MSDPIESEEIERDGKRYLVELFPDEITGHPRDEGDCYDEEDFKHWENKDWGWVVLNVTPIIDGEPDHGSTAELGSIEYGWNPGWINPEHNPTGHVDLARIIADQIDHGKLHEVADENRRQNAKQKTANAIAHLEGLGYTVTKNN